MNVRIAITLACVLFSSTAMAGPNEEDDEIFDQAVKEFGYTAGAAWQCTPEQEKAKMEGEVLKAFSGLARLFGTDQAFFFAAAFGSGTRDEINKDNCSGFIKNFTDGMKSSTKVE